MSDVRAARGPIFCPFFPVDRMTFLPPAEFAAMLAMGACLGYFGGLFGIGGGIIAVPVFVLAFAMPQPLAQGTALVMMVPNLLVAWWRYQQKHPASGRAVLLIGVSGSLTTWAMAHFALGLDVHLLRILFALFLVGLGLYRLRQRLAAGFAEKPLALGRLPLLGAIGGGTLGLLGVGGGMIVAPLLSGWLGQRQTSAQSLALAMVTPGCVVALATYAGAGRVDWALGLPMAAGGLFTVSAGVALAHRLPEQRMRRLFSTMLIATGLWLIVTL